MEIGRKRFNRTAMFVAISLACAIAFSITTPLTASNSSQLTKQIFIHLADADYDAALKLIKQHLELYPQDEIMLYNAACASCRLDNPKAGSKYLIDAIKAGFNDFAHMRRDADLKPLRNHPIYKAILAARDAADNLLAQRSIDWWRTTFGEDSYRLDTDEELKLNFLTNLDDDDFQQMRLMLKAQAAYFSSTLFSDVKCQYVLVAYPNPQHARQLLPREITAGVYRHRKRELITTDIHSSLRHEFAHRMHHAHMDELGQEHSLWIQEGLGTLFEDYKLSEDGSIYFIPNERDKYAQRLEQTGKLMSLTEVIALSKKDLNQQAIMVYPQLRSIFRYLAEQKHLNSWYEKYITDFDKDPTGIDALQFVFDKPLDQIQDMWKKWLQEQQFNQINSSAISTKKSDQKDSTIKTLTR